MAIESTPCHLPLMTLQQGSRVDSIPRNRYEISKLSENNLRQYFPLSLPLLLHFTSAIESSVARLFGSAERSRPTRVPNTSRHESKSRFLSKKEERGREAQQRSWLNNIWRLPRGCRINVVVFAQQFPACSSCAVGPFAEGGGRRLMSRVSPSPSFRPRPSPS